MIVEGVRANKTPGWGLLWGPLPSYPCSFLCSKSPSCRSLGASWLFPLPAFPRSEHHTALPCPLSCLFQIELFRQTSLVTMFTYATLSLPSSPAFPSSRIPSLRGRLHRATWSPASLEKYPGFPHIVGIQETVVLREFSRFLNMGGAHLSFWASVHSGCTEAANEVSKPSLCSLVQGWRRQNERHPSGSQFW